MNKWGLWIYRQQEIGSKFLQLCFTGYMVLLMLSNRKKPSIFRWFNLLLRVSIVIIVAESSKNYDESDMVKVSLVCVMTRAQDQQEPTSHRLAQSQFWQVGFVLSLAILEGKNFKALKCWTENRGEHYLIITEANQENKTYVQMSFVLHAYTYGFFMWRSTWNFNGKKYNL